MTYLHHVPGRLRVRAAGVKGEARRATLRNWLLSLAGVKSVEISPVTGSVLIHYRIGVTDGDRLVSALRERGWLTAPVRGVARRVAHPDPAERSMEHLIAHAVLRQVAEIALQRGLVALFAAVL
jgi:hypothetical protein